MNAKTKTVAPNYTAEQVAEMTAAYTANKTRETVQKIAAAFGKSEAAIRMKLVNLGVYEKTAKVNVTKTGEPVQKKDETAHAIGAILRLPEADVDSLSKANKRALSAIWKALAESKSIEGTDTAAQA